MKFCTKFSSEHKFGDFSRGGGSDYLSMLCTGISIRMTRRPVWFKIFLSKYSFQKLRVVSSLPEFSFLILTTLLTNTDFIILCKFGSAEFNFLAIILLPSSDSKKVSTFLSSMIAFILCPFSSSILFRASFTTDIIGFVQHRQSIHILGNENR